MKKDPIIYIEHISACISRIKEYTAGIDEDGFIKNNLIQDAVIRNFEIIGEASHNIEIHHPEFALVHPELPLAFAYQMRNAIAHGYFKVDFEIVWNTIQKDIPQLYNMIKSASLTLS